MGVVHTKIGSEKPGTVSVVIPTHNRVSLLTRAIRSVLNQTYQDLEIIVVDDASQDGTKEAVESIRDPRIRYIYHETNRGGSAARNTGIRAATGAFISFLDDDDEWVPEKTEQQLMLLETYDVVLCTSNEDVKPTGKLNGTSTVELDELRKGRFTAGGTGVLMARAHILKEILFDEDLPRCQDWDIFIRIASQYTIGYLDRPLVKYNEGEHDRISNVIINMPAAELEKRLIILEKHKRFFGPRWYKRHLGRFLLYGLRHRNDKLHHLVYTVKKCGLGAVIWALARRLHQKLLADIIA